MDNFDHIRCKRKTASYCLTKSENTVLGKISALAQAKLKNCRKNFTQSQERTLLGQECFVVMPHVAMRKIRNRSGGLQGGGKKFLSALLRPDLFMRKRNGGVK